MFRIARSGSMPRTINTTDLLTAVRQCYNVEGELYCNEELIVDCLGLSQEENIKNLAEAGITVYVSNHNLCFKYTDDALNTSDVYVWDYTFPWGDGENVQIFIYDYENSEAKQRFDSVDEALVAMREKYAGQYSAERISVTRFTDAGCETLNLFPSVASVG